MNPAPHLTASEAAVLQGALIVSNEELAGALADCIQRVRTIPLPDDHVWIEDLRELAAVALVTARRLEAHL